VSGYIQIQLDGKDIKISTNIPDEPMRLSGDRDKLKQVVLNLLSNAIKYNRTGGMILINAFENPTHVVFSVQDNGPGIAPEYLPRLFDRFYRLPSTERLIKGTGLGLTICKHIIDAHNGEIEVSSVLGQGSKIHSSPACQHRD
jgi:two-component system phosphate regulon sensor histidine kinase PhoR